MIFLEFASSKNAKSYRKKFYSTELLTNNFINYYELKRLKKLKKMDFIWLNKEGCFFHQII